MRNPDSRFYNVSNTVSGVRCVKVHNGEELYFCKDVCRLLGYRNYRNAMKFFCNHTALRYNVVIPTQGPRSTALIDANDVLSLIKNSANQLEENVIAFQKYVKA